MTDYKRMVSYMYQYENGVKKKNVGFARIEAKEGQCKITIHMQLLGQLDSIFPTYLIQRKDEGMELIYLGDTVLKNQVMDSKLVAEEGNIMDTGYGLSDMGGILLFLNDGVFFATEWDNKPVIEAEVIEALKPKPKEENKLSLAEELLIPKYKLPRGYKIIERLQTAEAFASASTIDYIKLAYHADKKPQDRGLQEKAQAELTRVAQLKNVSPELTDTTKQSNAIELTGTTEQTNTIELTDSPEQTNTIDLTDSSELTDSIERSDSKKLVDSRELTDSKGQSNPTDVSQSLQESSEIVREFTEVTEKGEQQEQAAKARTKYGQRYFKPTKEEQKEDKQREVEQKGKEQAEAEQTMNEQMRQLQPEREQLQGSDRTDQQNQTGNKFEQAEMIDPQAVQNIFAKFPRIYPFEDNEILLCTKIEPKDIGMLPKELWVLSNNSFLVHGYYCYHHLIFAKLKDRYGSRYILGVPGIYHNRERFMARMFGFDGFKPIRKRELRQGDFGYWYMPVRF